VNSCIFIADNCDVITGFTEEDVQSCEAVTSMEKTLSGDKYLEEESSDAFVHEAIAVQEGVLVNEEEDQLEELAYKPTVETIELCDFQTEDLCVSAGTVSDSEMLQQCYREIALLEYLLVNSEYDREIVAEERVQYSEQEEKDIMETDGVKEGLIDSLENSLESLDQHTDVLIVEENSEQHTKVLAEGSKALMPYDFYFNKCFVNAGIVAGAEEHLTQLSSQMKEDENSMEISNPWDEEVMLLERMLNDQNSVQK